MQAVNVVGKPSKFIISGLENTFPHLQPWNLDVVAVAMPLVGPPSNLSLPNKRPHSICTPATKLRGYRRETLLKLHIRNQKERTQNSNFSHKKVLQPLPIIALESAHQSSVGQQQTYHHGGRQKNIRNTKGNPNLQCLTKGLASTLSSSTCRPGLNTHILFGNKKKKPKIPNFHIENGFWG